MISESFYVKRDLYEGLEGVGYLIEHWEVEDNESDSDQVWEGEADEPSLGEALVAIEHFVFWSALAIRKLSEATKLSDELEASRVPVTRFPLKPGSPVADYMNWHRYSDHYDLDRQTSETMKVGALCNRLIHSFVFIPVMAEDQRSMEGLLFNSDRTHKRGLWYLDWQDYTGFVMDVVEDDVVSASYDRRTGILRKSRADGAFS